ncbi:MAG: pyruvate kinase [Bacteroidetes bacterium]|nr:pyruvate kinase [Bacteroidota bacterium]
MISEKKYGRTKIVCTLGPATSTVEILVNLIHAGMDVARLNFSHGTHEEHLAMMERVREASNITGEPISILLDLQGPKIRTGKVKEPMVLRDGEQLVISIEDFLGEDHRISTTYPDLPNDVQPGDTILMDDGLLQFTVLSKNEKEVVTKVVHGGILKSNKGINLPGIAVSAPSLSEKDKEDVLFGIQHDIDYIALSFVRTASDVIHLRNFIIANIDKRKMLPIIAKIEKDEALKNIDEIIREADGIMVARGDLGVECAPEEVPIAQKMIARKANAAGKPVIIATQMLDSMIENPRPTRAEANDVANAVLDGADAVMLSGETSIGKYPIETVKTMDNIIRRTECEEGDKLSLEDSVEADEVSLSKALGRAACVLAKQINAAAIISFTRSGQTVKTISRYRPTTQIIGIADRERIQRRLNLIWGVRSLLITASNTGETDTTISNVMNELKNLGYIKAGDYVVLTAGIPLMSRNSTNMIKAEKIQ